MSAVCTCGAATSVHHMSCPVSITMTPISDDDRKRLAELVAPTRAYLGQCVRDRVEPRLTPIQVGIINLALDMLVDS